MESIAQMAVTINMAFLNLSNGIFVFSHIMNTKTIIASTMGNK